MHSRINIGINDWQCLALSKAEFNKQCRRVSIKNIPFGISTQDISDLLKPYFYQQIHLDKNSQSCKAILLDGSCATRCIEELDGKQYRGQILCVSLALCDFMLCITQVPFSYTESQFFSLVKPFGTPERCFLVYSELTGFSKGYGCVEFTSKESSIRAKNQLNGYVINDNILQVHWLDTIPTTYAGLASSCLLVDNLPLGFDNMPMLKRLFSCFVIPKFCQVAKCKNKEFGVVEYQNPVDCENAWLSINKGYTSGKLPFKVTFCVPGPSGLVMLNSLKASQDFKSAGGLLPTPVQSTDYIGQTYGNLQDSTQIDFLSNDKNVYNLKDCTNFTLKQSKDQDIVEKMTIYQKPSSTEMLPSQNFPIPTLLVSSHKNYQFLSRNINMNHSCPTKLTRILPTSGALLPTETSVKTGDSNAAKISPFIDDSPTQLRLLGNNFLKGLFDDSPQHKDDRLINALNLMKPDNLSPPCTPSVTQNRRRLLPSPEPSPEAGAYVGQHSQGIGGHYADSYCRSTAKGDFSSPFSPIYLHRSRCNEI